MAVLKGVRVNVRSAEEYLHEYKDDSNQIVEETEDETIRYIESHPGANFEIEADRYPLLGPHPSKLDGIAGLSFSVYVDGTFTSKSIRNFSTHRTHITIKGAYSWKNGTEYVQKYAFSEIQTTEDQPKEPKELKSLVAAASKLGTITVTVQRVSHIAPDTGPPFNHKAISLCNEVFPEKALKGSAVSHLSKLENPEVKEQGRLVVCNYIDPKENPYATFHFKYRSHRALQIEGIIPREASPTITADPPANPSAAGPLAEYSTDELRRILQQRDQAANGRAKLEDRNTPVRVGGVKREPDPDVELVSERSRGKRKVKSEVIDLCGD